MTIDRFTDDLLAQTAQVWEKVHRHPFVRGLGDGSLSVESFRFYMVQDYLFLIEFCRVLALGAAKSPDLETMGRFTALLHETLHSEMALHRTYAARFGITEAELESARPSAATHAYTRHLLHAAQSGSVGELAAALEKDAGALAGDARLRVLAEVAQTCTRYRARVVTDQYAAPAIVDTLRREGLSVETVPMTPQSKTAAFVELRARLTAGTLDLYEHADLLAELRRLRTRYAAGSASVVNPRVGGSHGDLAQALALAVYEHDRYGFSSGGPPRIFTDSPTVGFEDYRDSGPLPYDSVL